MAPAGRTLPIRMAVLANTAMWRSTLSTALPPFTVAVRTGHGTLTADVVTLTSVTDRLTLTGSAPTVHSVTDCARLTTL